MKTLQEIETEIKRVREKCKYEEFYWESEEGFIDQENILTALQENFGYHWENDEKAIKYFLKATDTEIWMYYLAVILPTLKRQHQNKEEEEPEEKHWRGHTSYQERHADSDNDGQDD